MKSAYRPQNMAQDTAWFEDDLLRRFSRYVAIHTTSAHHGDTYPSTPGQWDLARKLRDELLEMGLASVELTEQCYVIAIVPSTMPTDAPTVPVIGFLAHVDTSPDCSGENVHLVAHHDYNGSPLALGNGEILDPAQSPALRNHIGKTILTSDGSTLLGADDKAGVAEIMSAVRWLLDHPEIQHGDLEIIFTPDEEIGRGVDKLPMDRIRSKICYTLDGDEEGSYNAQCFNGWSITVTFRGRMIHPGDARGRLVNPVTMAGMYIANIPRNESPESTDGDFGYYCPQEIHGGMEEATFTLFIRDFDIKQIERRLAYLRQLALTVEASFPGGSVTVTERKQYRNMWDAISAHPGITARLEQSIRDSGMQPVAHSIRGGTDGARLSELGIPTPNIFAGGHNFHSKHEWIPLQSMVRASKVIINLAQLWTCEIQEGAVTPPQG